MKTLLVMALVFILGGCAVTRNAVGRFDDINENFKGSVTIDLMGDSQIDVVSELSKTRCSGPLRVTQTSPLGFCSGQRGKADLTCSNGRRLDVDWVASTYCTTGRGMGRGQDGALFRFVFGYDYAAAEAELAKAR